jgi:hypothetical protein
VGVGVVAVDVGDAPLGWEGPGVVATVLGAAVGDVVGVLVGGSLVASGDGSLLGS